ncbi:MAG: hypothetical protein ACLQVY_08640 [Limisphaerales bacterium]
MNDLSTTARAARVAGAILLAAHRACIAEAEETPPARSVTVPNDNNPYSLISDRNVFHLNPPPLPQLDKGPPPILPVVLLSGFMRTGDQTKVLLAVNTQRPDPHGRDLTTYLTMAEGDKQEVGAGDKRGSVELVKIYAEQEKIDIINSGTPVTLSIKDDGFNSPAAAKSRLSGTAAINRGRAPNLTPAALAAMETPPPLPGNPRSRDGTRGRAPNLTPAALAAMETPPPLPGNLGSRAGTVAAIIPPVVGGALPTNGDAPDRGSSVIIIGDGGDH